MQAPYQQGGFLPQESGAFYNTHTDRESWFPTDPDCPNHKVGVPFSSAYADPNADGQVSCAECFLHSTIMQSMSMSCHHLHACASCANCYSHNGHSPPTVAPGISPPLFSCNISPPMFHPGSPQTSPYEASKYKQLAPTQPYHSEVDNFHPDPHRRASFPMQSHPGNQADSQSYSSPNTPSGSCYQTAVSDYSATSETTLQRTDNAQSSSHDYSLQIAAKSAAPKHSNGANLDYSRSVSFDTGKVTSKTPLSPPKEVKHEITQNRKRSANDVCEVCGDRASGYHYNALTCEGCKGFFRRSIYRKNSPYKCKYGGSCEMDTYTRRKCPDCRLRKCKAVGMLEECLLNEIQRSSKQKSRQKSKQKDKPSENENSSASVSVATTPSEKSQAAEKAAKAAQQKRSSNEQLVRFVGAAFSDYRANPEIVKRWASYLENSSKSHPNLCEVATVHVKVLVEFTKKLPGFLRVGPEDQIALLKGSVMEIMLLRNSCGYNLKKGDIDVSVVVKDTGLHETHFRVLLDFFSRIDHLKLDETEYGLLIAIVLFDSDHQQTQDKARIDRYRETYVSALTYYSESREPKRTQIVAKILNLITGLRTLYDTHARMVSNMREKTQLSPLLCEIWDLR